MPPTPSEAAAAAVEPDSLAPAMIEARNLSKVHGHLRAVDQISFEVRRGEIMGFLGPNGAGKTTTLRILACFAPATSGQALIAGHDVSADPVGARRNLGYLPENAPVYGDMKVRPYLEFMSKIKAIDPKKRNSFIDRAIEETDLQEVSGRLIGNLSHGFRQRVGLAQAILGDPAVLILDEPTVGLDPRQIVHVRDVIKAMAGRRTVLMSTHILPEVSMICDRVVVIDRGRVVASGTPKRLVSSLDDENHPFFVTVGGEYERVMRALRSVDGVERIEPDPRPPSGPSHDRRTYHLVSKGGAEVRPALARALHEGEIRVYEIGRRGASLEEVFLRAISSPGRENARENGDA